MAKGVTPIRWKENEIDQIIDRFTELFGWEPTKWPKSLTVLTRDYQTVLPPERQRNRLVFSGAHAVVTVQSRFDERKRKHTREVNKAAKSAEGVNIDTAHKSKTTNEELRAEMDRIDAEIAAGKAAMLKQSAKPPADFADDLRRSGSNIARPSVADVPAAELYNQLKARFADDASSLLASIAVDAVKKFFTNGDIAKMLWSLRMGQVPDAVRADPVSLKVVPKHDPTPTGPARIHKTVAVVCGFNQSQQAQFTQVYGDKLHLKFWYSDSPNRHIDTLREKCKSADVALFNMAASSHTATAAAESVGCRVVRVTGGGSAMLDALGLIATTSNGAEPQNEPTGAPGADIGGK